MFERDNSTKQENCIAHKDAPPEKRQGPPPKEVLEDPQLRQKTGRNVPDVWQNDVTEESMPSPVQREETAHTLCLDPVDPVDW